MKKAFLSALLIAGFGLSMSSCNNGDYNATPDINQSTILNPLNPSSGVTIPIGYIQCDFNGYQAAFTAGIWTDTIAGTAMLTASRIDTATQVQGITIQITGYTGPGTYTFGPDGAGGSITHILYNPLDGNYVGLGFTTAIGAGSGTITIEGAEDGNLRGKFSGTLFQYADVINTDNKEEVTKGMFYLPKL